MWHHAWEPARGRRNELQTRVTGLDELKVKTAGEDCLVVIYAPVQTELGRRYVISQPVIRSGEGATTTSCSRAIVFRAATLGSSSARMG